MGAHYNEGYLQAVRTGTFAVRGVVQRAPRCPYLHDRCAAFSWWAGVLDAATDIFEAAAPRRA